MQNFIPDPSRIPNKEPNAGFMDSARFFLFIISPVIAPRNGPKSIPKGPKIISPITRPIEAPINPPFEPPSFLTPTIGII